MAATMVVPDSFFDDDDEETQQYLLARLAVDGTLPSRLESLSKRFRVDHGYPSLDELWKGWSEDVKNDVFFSTCESSNDTASSVSSSSLIPETFDSDDGRTHLEATKALLGLRSDNQIARLTVSALRDLHGSRNLQALLGTFGLVAIVMDYHYKQRLSRIEVIAELLRLEPEGGVAGIDCIGNILGELDSSYTIDGKNRGLFKCLVSIACKKIVGEVQMRDQILKSKATTLRESANQRTGESSWHKFAANCVGSSRACMRQERLRAMEALVALLYTYLEGGVGRVDYMIILKAFQSADNFFTTCVDSEKLSHLAGLVCAQCTGLWRVFEDDNPVDPAWIINHPLLVGVLPSDDHGTLCTGASQAEAELEALKLFLTHLPDQHQMEARGMAFLSLGLLFMTAYNAILSSTLGSDGGGYWQVFHDQGKQLVMSASSDLAVFDTLYATMCSLVLDPSVKASDKKRSDLPFNWLMCRKPKTTLAEFSQCADDAETGMSMDGASSINAFIGQEILIAVIFSFGDSILALEHELVHDNLSMMCDLVASIYRSNPSLCQHFWREWEQYTSPDPPATCYWPMCRLVDLAFLLLNKSINVTTMGKEDVLASITPLMQLLSSFCYCADRVLSAFQILDPTLLQYALCTVDVDAQLNERFSKNRWRFFHSLAVMTRLGDSSICRDIIRDALGVAGPAFLFKATASSDAKISESALDIVADLLKEAPVEWTLSFARRMQTLVNQNFFEGQEFRLARVFNALAMSLPLVAFSELVSESEADNLLDMIWRGVLRLSPVLSLCLSNVTRESVSLNVVSEILDFFSNYIENIGSLVSFRQPLSTQANRTRSAMVELMSSHLGESLMFYALLPLSWNIGCGIEAYAKQITILQSATKMENNQSSNCGLWSATLTTGSAEMQNHVKRLVETTTTNPEKVDRGSGEAYGGVLSAVSKSLGLLRLWALTVEDIVTGESGSRQEGVSLTQEQKERLSSLSPHRLLAMPAPLPNPMRANGIVKSLFESARTTNFQLLIRYFERGVWPVNLCALSLDLLHTCVSHRNMTCMQEILKDEVQRSNLFELLVPLAADGSHLTKINATALEGDIVETRVLSILAFRLATATFDALSTLEGVENVVGKLVKAAFKGIEGACDHLHEFREAKSNLGQDSNSLVDDLVYGASCLGFVRAIWDDADQKELSLKLTKAYDNGSSAFTALAKILLQHAHKDNKLEPAESGCVYSFLAASVHFLRLATKFALSMDQISDSAMLRMVKDNALQLISMPQNFLAVDTSATVAITKEFSAFADSLSSKMTGSAYQTLLAHFPIVSLSDGTIGFFNVNVSSMSVCLAPLHGDLNFIRDISFSFAMAHHNLHTQVALVCQWRKFADVLLRLSDFSYMASSRGDFGNGALVPQRESHSATYLLAASEVLHIILNNSTGIELAEVDGAALTMQNVSEIAQSTSGLVLMLLSASDICSARPASPDALIQLLGLVSLCATKLFNILKAEADICCHVVQHLLTAAIGVLMSVLPTKLDDSVDQLVLVMHRLLQLLEVQSVENNDCLKTCIVLLTMLTTAKGGDLLGGKPGLAEMLKDIVCGLVRGGKRRSEAVSAGFARRGGADEIEVLESIVDFLQACLESSSEMLDLVCSCGALQLLIRNPMFERASEVWGSQDGRTTLRGYIPTQKRISPESWKKNTAFFAGSEDPQHIVWRKSLRCFRTLCRSQRRFFAPSSARWERFQSLAADFIYSYREVMLACLKIVESSAFTRNSLEEATLILSLLTEFCGLPCRDGRALQLISGFFLPLTLQLVARLGNFLGASSASRELFNSMGNSDNGEDSDLDMTPRLSPFNRVHNARHEAIRYSHYASRFCTAVTCEEVSETSSVQNRSQDDQRSATALEKHGKTLMSSNFALALEHSAAECLFSGTSLLWERHPANSCFVKFDSPIDAMPHVKPGGIIGYYSDRENHRAWHLGYLHFGKVLHVSTLDHVWYVRDLETEEDEIVKANQIAGMEDTSKRRCVLRFAAAPDSATDLDSDIGSVSVGHVILALRWCSVMESSLVGSRLAELLSLFLGAELQIHKEIGSSLGKTPEVLLRLYSQLLDLYGEAREGASWTQGRLNGILNGKSWANMRLQLKEELQAADETREKNMMVVEDDGLFFRGRNSSGRNPLHDLSRNYQ